MKHAGRARKASFKLILISLIAILLLIGVAFAAAFISTAVAAITPLLLVLWVIFSIFTLYFFRDPNPNVPSGAKLVLSPAHGKVDVVDTTAEPQFMGGECRRVSIFLSVVDVHVQNAPVGGRITFFKYSIGEFMNAIRSECATCNENLLLGFESAEAGGVKIGLRLVAGVIARRIVPFVKLGEDVVRGERISLIQFGSRTEMYLPMNARIAVKLGDRVVGGQTVLAQLE